MTPTTPPSPQPHRIKRKPAPSICGDLETRYPPPDPSDPLASLAALRARNRATQQFEKETHVLDCDVHIASPDATLSAWYEVYPSSPLGFGYLSSHPYRVPPSKKSAVSRKGSVGHEKRTSHYRPRSLSMAQQSETRNVEELPTSRSLPPPLTFDSDDTSSEGRSLDDASVHTSADFCLSSRSSVMSSHHGHETLPPAKPALETVKARRRLSKRSSLASSRLSYSTAPATLSSEPEKQDTSPAASVRSHPFAHSSNSLRTTPLGQGPRGTGSNATPTPPRFHMEALPSTRSASSGSFASYVHVLSPSTPPYVHEARPLSPVDERAPAIGIPTIHDLSYASTCHVVAENGVRVAFGDLCASSTTIVCFIRHFWCTSSQDYVAALCKEIDVAALERAGSRLILVANGSPHMIRAYKRMFHAPFDMYCDPSQRLYEALGLGRVARDHHHHHSHGLVRLFFRAVKAGMPVWGKGGDPDQLGGEFVFGGSTLRCKFAHRMTQVGDHTPIPQLFVSAGLCSALRNPPKSVCVQEHRPPLRRAYSSFLQMTDSGEGRTNHAP